MKPLEHPILSHPKARQDLDAIPQCEPKPLVGPSNHTNPEPHIRTTKQPNPEARKKPEPYMNTHTQTYTSEYSTYNPEPCKRLTANTLIRVAGC